MTEDEFWKEYNALKDAATSKALKNFMPNTNL